jgi:hypothetical protein
LPAGEGGYGTRSSPVSHAEVRRPAADSHIHRRSDCSRRSTCLMSPGMSSPPSPGGKRSRPAWCDRAATFLSAPLGARARLACPASGAKAETLPEVQYPQPPPLLTRPFDRIGHRIRPSQR